MGKNCNNVITIDFFKCLCYNVSMYKIRDMYKEKKELALLELAYLSIAAISFVAAAVTALFNQSLGIAILIVPLAALIVAVANIVVWSLVKSIVEAKDDKKVARK